MEIAEAQTVARLTQVVRSEGPAFGDYASAAGQGEYIWAGLAVSWGDIDLLEFT